LSYRVLDYVRRSPVTVKPDTPIRDAVRVMFEGSIGSVVIVDDSGRPVGIFTERDLVRVVAQGAPLEAPVGSVMTRDPVTVKAGDSIVKAAIIMSERRIRHLPVVDDNGVLVGVISIRDVVDALKSALASRAAESEMAVFTG